MDRNTSAERRLSVKSLQAAHPLAESTCVTMNGTRPTTQFQWGGTPISPKNRSNSSINLNSTNRSSTTTTRIRTKIDPRIYADVQSKGLTSRIVKYHENGLNFNRSMSMSNINSRFGHFPVVHLKKVELPYKASKANVSMTRIAPPDRSVFYGNTLPSLLRSNSVVGIKKSDEEISRENRPIIHPPSTENDMEPKPSVLEVLKEISRKRISNDDLDSCGVTKKYCSHENGDGDESTQDSCSKSPNGLKNSFKRQREYIGQPNTVQTQAQNCIVANRGGNLSQQNSPEQAKKRQCSYNNDITSSLSSSLLHANKRKMFLQISTDKTINGEGGRYRYCSTSVDEDYEAYRARSEKQKERDQIVKFDQLAKKLNSHAPITPLPNTPIVNEAVEVGKASSLQGLTYHNKANVPPIRTTSAPLFATNKVNDEPIKRKITLFNKDYSTVSNGGDINVEEQTVSEDSGEYAGIQFVKPKKSRSISGLKNPILERTQKSKLAVMLSGLRGEVYQGENDDEIDARAMAKDPLPATASNPIHGHGQVPAGGGGGATTTRVSLTTNTTTTTVTSTKTSIIDINATKLNPLENKNTFAAANSIQMNNSTSAPDPAPLPGANALTTSPATPTPIAVGNIQPIGGLKSPTPMSTAAVFAQPPATPPSSNIKKSPLVGLKLTPQTPPSTVAPTPSFGIPTATAAPEKPPNLGGFSFGSLPHAASAPTTNPSVTSSPAPFSFGLAINSIPAITSTFETLAKSSTTSNSTPTMSPSSSSFVFTTPTKELTTNPPAPSTGLTFGSNVVKTAATSFGIAKPTFAFGGSSSTIRTEAQPTEISSAAETVPKPMFSLPSTKPTTFGGNNNAFSNNDKNNNTNNLFQFGTSNTTNTPAAQPSTSSFSFSSAAGSAPEQAAVKPPTAATSQFAFGSSTQSGAGASIPATPVTNTFTFGSGNATVTPKPTTGEAPKSFSSGGSSAVANAANPSSVTNSFAFGGSSAATTKADSNTPLLFGSASSNVFSNAESAPAAPNAGAGAGAGANAATKMFNFGSGAGGGGPIAFGANSPPNTSTPFTFAPKTDATNAISGGFSFTAQNSNIFGGGGGVLSSPSSKPMFSFSSGNTATGSANTAAQSVFGSSVTSPGSASINAANVATATNANLFAPNANNNTNTNNKNITSPSGGFSFGGGSVLNKPTGIAAPNAAFSFGSNNAAGISSPAVKPFSFTGSDGAVTNSGTGSTVNIFGAASAASAKQSQTLATGAFNFTAGNPAQQTSTLGMAPATDGRPIRRATRRLQKP